MFRGNFALQSERLLVYVLVVVVVAAARRAHIVFLVARLGDLGEALDLDRDFLRKKEFIRGCC
jgi:hypothetical protein